MFLIILALICALAISGVAIFYSVLGLGAIFAAAKVPIYIMGGVLEIAKLVTASWLYQNWRNIPILLKTYLTLAVAILMIITSLGIFGFLSKAHIEQASPAAETVAQITNIDEKIIRQKNTITNLESKINRLTNSDASVEDLIEREQKIIDTANSKIKADVDLIQTKINNAQTQIDGIQTASENQIKDIQIEADKKIEIARTDAKEEIETLRIDQNAIITAEEKKMEKLDQAVTKVLTTKKNFFNEEKEAQKLKDSQARERNQINIRINNARNKIQTDTQQINNDLDKTIVDIQTTADEQINVLRTDANTQTTELRSKIDAFNAEISALQASVADEVALAKQRINEINTDAISDKDSADKQIAEYEIQINDAYDNIDALNGDKFVLESKIRDLEAEVGPIKYIAQFFDADGDVDLEKAVTWLIITIMFVFDPLAVLLLIAVNMSLKARYGWNFEGKGVLDKNKLSAKDYKTLNLDQPANITSLEKKVYNKVKGE